MHQLVQAALCVLSGNLCLSCSNIIYSNVRAVYSRLILKNKTTEQVMPNSLWQQVRGRVVIREGAGLK